MEEDNEQKLRERMVKGFLEMKVHHENELCRLNEFKLNSLLLSRLRGLKLNELHSDGELYFSHFKNIIKCKDQLKELLQNQLKDAEIQHTNVASYNYDCIHEILADFQKRAKGIRKCYVSKLDNLNEEFDKTKVNINNKHSKTIKQLSEIQQENQKRYEKLHTISKQKYDDEKTKIREKEINYKQEMNIIIERKQEKLWQLIFDCYQTYENNTKENLTIYKELREKDKKYVQDIKMRMKKTIAEKENIKNLEAKLLAVRQEKYETNHPLQQEKERLQKETVKNVKQQQRNLRESKEKMKHLVRETDKIIEQLKFLVKKAERILKIYELYSPFELEEDKLEASFMSPLNVKEQLEIENGSTSGIKEYKLLEIFVTRHSKVLLDNCVLEKEIEELCKENVRLQQTLKAYTGSNTETVFEELKI